MNQKLAGLLNFLPQQGVQPGTGPLLLAQNGEAPLSPQEQLMQQMAQPKPPNVTETQMVRTSGSPMKYTDQFEDAFKASLDDREKQIGTLQEELSQKNASQPGWLEQVNLRPALAFADSLTGGHSASQYQAPTAKAERQRQIERLEDMIQKQQGALSDDQLGYLKQRASEENMLKREELANKRIGAMMGRHSDTSEDKLRAQYLANPLYKGMAEISKAYQAIENNPGVGGPGQQALIYQFSRILDPTSVVRETEYAMSAANAGKINEARMLLTKWQSGQRLSPEQVRDMKEVAGNLVRSARTSLDAHNQTYTELSKRKGVDPRNVVIDAFQGSQAQGSGPGGAMSFEQWKASQGK